MTTSSDLAARPAGPTAPLPASEALPELTTPQERYDHGYQRGYAAGHAEGLRQAQAEQAAGLASHQASWAASQARAQALLAQLSTATQQYIDQYGPHEPRMTEELLRAAFELAEAVVGLELRTRPTRAAEVAHQVLMALPTGPAIVRVNPDDIALLEQPWPSLGNAAQGVAVVADASVGPGGCVVSSGGTTVDARLCVALDRVREAFLGGDAPEGLPATAPGGGTA